MKKEILLTLLAAVTVNLNALGFLWGPLSNEKNAIEEGDLPLYFYDVPQFYGGLYNLLQIDEDISYFCSLSYSNHGARIYIGDMYGNHILTFINDIHYKPFHNSLYISAGLHSLLIFRDYNDGENPTHNFYTTFSNFLCCGIGQEKTLNRIQLGYNFSCRIFPFNTNEMSNSAEFSVYAGFIL